MRSRLLQNPLAQRSSFLAPEVRKGKSPMAAGMEKKLDQVTSTETVSIFHILLKPLALLK